MFDVSTNTLNRVVIFSLTFEVVEISKSFTVCQFLKKPAAILRFRNLLTCIIYITCLCFLFFDPKKVNVSFSRVTSYKI